KLLIEFSHKERYNVLKELYHEGKRHSELQSELNIPGSEISRHLGRLKDKNLVFKDVQNKYQITNIGKIFIRVMDIFEVSLIHRDFFNSHEITSIPVFLIFKLGKLRDVEFGNKIMENMEIFENLVKNSDEFLYAITDQYQKSLLKEAENKMRNKSIKIRALVDRNLLKSYNIPNGWSKLFNDPKVFFKEMLENIRLFLNKNSEIDYSQCLIDNHNSFISWAKELFEWYWKKGMSLQPFIRKEMRLKD
ncbi:MAG: hypothetical protein ACFFDF_24415, partial [Candidatus Odinarchaeota archaeon]